MLTTSVAAASMSDSFSYKLMHITPTKGVNRHSPVAGFIIAHRFVTGKHKTEQMIACSVFVCDAKSEVVRSIRSCSIYSCRYADNGLATFSYVAGGGAPAERDAGTGAGASRDVPICFDVRGHCARKSLITAPRAVRGRGYYFSFGSAACSASPMGVRMMSSARRSARVSLLLMRTRCSP